MRGPLTFEEIKRRDYALIVFVVLFIDRQFFAVFFGLIFFLGLVVFLPFFLSAFRLRLFGGIF